MLNSIIPPNFPASAAFSGSRRFLFAALLGFLAVAFAGRAQGEPRYISTIAGNGIAGINGDGLPPLSSALYLPQDGTFGPDGFFYFCDWNNHRIRRIANNIIEGVAGTGELGDAQDGPAISMKLNHPTGVSFDSTGGLIISAWHNSKVKRLDLSTGLCVNIAGTGARAFGGDDAAANAARLDLPSSTVQDSDGNIYISDQANFRIRRLDTSGNITTFCGSGVAGYTGDEGPRLQATIRSPVGQAAPPAGRLAIDSQNRIYIADTGNHVIRRVDADGMIRTIAGTGQAGYLGDGGPATAAKLNTPSDVAVAADGTIYIADTMNSAIRKVATDGTITTIAGTGFAGFSGDGGLGSDAKLNRPYGVAIGPAGQVVIADTHNHRLRVLTEDPVDTGPGEEDPEIEIIPCSNEVGSICTYAGTGYSAFNGDGKDRQRTHLYWPFDIEFTPSGRVYLIDWNSHRIRQILADGQVVTVMGTDFVGDGPPDLSDQNPPGAPGLTIDLNHPTDMHEFPSGELLVVNWHNHKFRQLDPATGLVRILLGGPVGFAGDGGIAKAARVNQPSRGMFDSHGNFIFVDQRNQRLRVVKDFINLREQGIVATIAGTGTPGFNGDGPALTTQFSFPTGTNPEPTGGMVVDANGVVYFADTNNHRIRKIVFSGADFTDGQVTTVAGTGTAGNGPDGGLALESSINYPQDLELGPDGKLYFADTNNNRIRRIDLQSGVIEAVAGTGEEGYSGDGGSALTATFNRPFGIAFDKVGNLYVSDTFNSRIRKIKMNTTSEGPEPILPSNYRDNYVEVRDCRFSLEHGGVYIRVLADPETAHEYLEDANPLPVGGVVVKEEFSDEHCDISELVRWRVMRKEAPGFDPDGDWHWQWLTPRREVVYDDKSTCISCHLQPDCVARDYMCTLPGGGTELKLILDKLPATLVSVSGSPPEDGHNHGHSINYDVYAVGADPGDGRGPFVVNYDGGEWRRLNTGATGDLWWITDRMIDGNFYMAGENGLILRMTHETKVFQRMQTPGGKLLFGVWGTDLQNLWAVGGDLSDEDQGGAVWKFNGTEWVNDATVLEARPEGLPTLYKIWGRSATDVFAVGRLGVALHYNGVRWRIIPTGVTRPLFTVHGNDQRVVATGGAFQGVLLELEGEAFVDRTPVGAPQVNGVYVSAGASVAVGSEGSYAIRGANGWELKAPVISTRPLDFHGTWMDAAGAIWAVGGDLTVDQDYGVLAFAGSATIGRNFESDEPCAPGVSGPPKTVSYNYDVVPLLRQSNCLNGACHGGFNPTTDYDLRSYESMFGPGEVAKNFGMCNIVPGNPEASFLIEKLGPSPRSGARMPDTFSSLTEAQITLLSTWIREGAIKDGPRPFTRADINLDGLEDITDAITVLGFLFLGDPAKLPCKKAGDINDDSELNITDPITLLEFVFLGRGAIAQPYPSCGQDPTDDDDVSCDATHCQ